MKKLAEVGTSAPHRSLSMKSNHYGSAVAHIGPWTNVLYNDSSEDRSMRTVRRVVKELYKRKGGDPPREWTVVTPKRKSSITIPKIGGREDGPEKLRLFLSKIKSSG